MQERIRAQYWLYAPILAILLVGAVVIFQAILQSRYSEISVGDQEVNDRIVTIDKAFLVDDGFVSIHRTNHDGTLVTSSSIGHKAAGSGLHFKLEVTLTEPVDDGAKLFAVVHRDSGYDGNYEFGPDAAHRDPIAIERGKPVASAFNVK